MTDEKEVSLELERVETAMSEKCLSHLDKFCKYMAEQEVVLQKLLLLCQASSTMKWLEKLASRGIVVPQDVMDKFNRDKARFEEKINNMEVIRINNNDLVLSPLMDNPIFWGFCTDYWWLFWKECASHVGWDLQFWIHLGCRTLQSNSTIKLLISRPKEKMRELSMPRIRILRTTSANLPSRTKKALVLCMLN